MENLITYGIITLVSIVFIVVVAVLIAKLYTRATKQMAFVRTGLGGTKVVSDGGAIVLPMFHETVQVNMNTIKLDVDKKNADALITLDRMRVDIKAEFYVRVKQQAESIAMAAQTLGSKTLNANELKALMEGKFVDALRAVAASMTMKELHEKRTDFVSKVQSSVTEDLEKNGLELESVSLTSFDQTNKEYFNPENAFDAEGLTALTQEIENRKKLRNDIEKDTQLQIAQKDLSFNEEQAKIIKNQEFIKLNTEKEIAFQKAEQEKEIANNNAEKEKERALVQEKLEREKEQAKIDREKAIQLANIEKDKNVTQENINKDKAIQQAKIVQQREIELAEQEKNIILAQKSEEEAAANAKAEKARANEVEAKQAVITVEAVATAKRKQQVEVLEAKTLAEKESVAVIVQAQAEEQASQARANAVIKEAEAEKDANLLKAQAEEKLNEVRATGARAINEAANILTQEQVNLQIKLRLLEQLPKIIAESVRPMEKIDSIKIVDMGNSFGKLNSGENVSADGNSNSLPDQVVQAALKHKAVSPLIDNLLSDVGIDLKDLNKSIQKSTTSLNNNNEEQY